MYVRTPTPTPQTHLHTHIPKQDTVVEVTQRVVTPEGIPRLQLYDGTWISERLRGARGGPEEPVVEVLRHNPPRCVRCGLALVCICVRM